MEVKNDVREVKGVISPPKFPPPSFGGGSSNGNGDGGGSGSEGGDGSGSGGDDNCWDLVCFIKYSAALYILKKM